MLSRDEVISRIISLHPDLTREEIQNMIQKKKEDAGQFLTDEGAIYMVANELGINVSNGRGPKTGVSIKDVMIGASDVTITGRVVSTSPVQTFKRSNGAEGRVARFVVADETGLMTVVLWDEKTSIISQEKLVPNQFVGVFHGYVKEGLSGRPELNVGQRGMVSILSAKPDTSSPSRDTELFKKIRDLKESDVSVNVTGIVRRVSSVSTFDRKDGSEGQVIRISLDDGTGRINVVLWDEKVDDVEEVLKGDYIRITNARVKKGLNDALEIHVGRLTKVVTLTEKPPGLSIPATALTKIGALKSGMMDADVLGRVAEVGQVREFTRPSGEVGRVGDLLLADETGSIRLSLWNERVDELKSISVGDTVLVRSAYTRESPFGVSLNLGKMGELEVNPNIAEAKKIPLIDSHRVMAINQLKPGLVSATIHGIISEEPSVKTVTTKDGEEIAVASFRVRDKTGEIRVSFWRDLASEVENLVRDTDIQIKNFYVKTGFSGNLELSSTSTTELEILSKPVHDDNETLEIINEEEEKAIEEEEKEDDEEEVF